MKMKNIPCRYCGNVEYVRKHGSGKSTKMQRYYCTYCVRTFQIKYIYDISKPETKDSKVAKSSHYAESCSNNPTTMNG